jgi:hypothetical protein
MTHSDLQKQEKRNHVSSSRKPASKEYLLRCAVSRLLNVMESGRPAFPSDSLEWDKAIAFAEKQLAE